MEGAAVATIVLSNATRNTVRARQGMTIIILLCGNVTSISSLRNLASWRLFSFRFGEGEASRGEDGETSRGVEAETVSIDASDAIGAVERGSLVDI